MHLLLVRGGRVLLARRYNTGYADGWLSLPGGHLDAGEPALLAVIREGREEVGVDVLPQDVSLVHLMHRRRTAFDDVDRLELFFRSARWSGTPRIAEPHRCDLLEWHDVTRLPTTTVDYVRHAIGRALVGMPYSEVGWVESP